MIVADNKLNDISDWNTDILGDWLNDLVEEDLETFFETGEMTEIWGDESKTPDKIVEDEVSVDAYTRAKKKSKVQLGEVYQLGSHRLMCGDSTKHEHVRKLTKDMKPVLMVTDPPYGVNYEPEWRNKTNLENGIQRPTKATGKVPGDDKVDWSDAYKLFEGDVMYVWHSGKHVADVEISIKESGFELVNQIIWVKPHFALSRGDYHWKHEGCWYAVRHGKKHNWQGSRNETTVWEIGGMNAFGGSKDEADEKTGHGTQKPVECMARPIRNNTQEGDPVYDPFGGSGSTLIACQQLNRTCLMMEIDPIYCQVILDRWEKFTGEKPQKIQ